MKSIEYINIQIRLPKKQDQAWLEQLHILILNNMNQPQFGNKQLAHFMQMSIRNLNYKVRLHTGFTPAKYINEIRLLTAEIMLRNKTYNTVSEVCYAVGFQKPAYFSILFKRRFNKLPSSYLHF